jgi:spore germination cell wall hydrolase CwlJ-like protein
LFSLLQTRVQARALGVFAASGAGLGLLLAAAFFAGGAAGDTAQAAQRMRVDEANERALRGIVADIAVQQEATPTAPANVSFLRPAVPEPSAPLAAAHDRTPPDLDCLTAAVYYEARGESQAGQAAVAQVVLNRVRHRGFPKSVCGVVYQGADEGECQFSFACDGSMDRSRDNSAWGRARAVAGRALSGYVMGAVGGATHYHAASLGEIWGGALIQVAQVGQHIFYTVSGHRPAPEPAAVEPPTIALPASSLNASTAPVPVTTAVGSVASSTASSPSPPIQTPSAPGAAS